MQLEWKAPDVDGLVQFLVTEKGFKYVINLFLARLSFFLTPHSEERVRKGAEKLTKFLNAKQQGRLDGFFSVQNKEPQKSKAAEKGSQKGVKRKVNISIVYLSCNVLETDKFSSRGTNLTINPKAKKRKQNDNCPLSPL